MDIEIRYPTTFPLVLASDGNFQITEPPPLEIDTTPGPVPPVPEPPPHACDHDTYHRFDFRGYKWRYHVEWGYADPDLLPADANDDTWQSVVEAFRHLPDEDRATRKANEEARREAREAAKKAAIEADKEDVKGKPKKAIPSQPQGNVDPAVETIVLAFVKLVAFRVKKWTEKYLDKKTNKLETNGQVALAGLRAGNRLREERIKKIGTKLDALAEKGETFEERRAKGFREIKARFLEKMRAEGVPRVMVSVRGEPSYRNARERPWYVWRKSTAKVYSIRRKRAALERRRELAIRWMHPSKKAPSKGGATIAEELFAEGLLKLDKLVPLLPKLGRRYRWDPDEAPDHIAHYLTTAVNNAIWDYREAASRFRGPPEKSLVPALKRKKANEYRRTIHRVVGDDTDECLYDGNTRYLVQCNRSGVVELEEQEYFQHALDAVCHDDNDKRLLWMKEQGIFTEDEIAEAVDLSVGEVNERLWRMRGELEELFELRRRKCWNKGETSKRASRDPEDRKLAQQLMARVRYWKQHPRSAVPAPHILILPATRALPAPSATDLSTTG